MTRLPREPSLALGKAATPSLKHASTRVLLVLLIASTTISYIDRQALSIAAPVLRSEFNMSNLAYSEVLFAFLLAYALFSPVMGRLIDNMGIRRGIPISVIMWSIASMLHATVRGPLSLAIFRFLLGMGEAGNFPGCIKAIAERIAPESRSLAAGIFNVGAGLGAILAPPLVVWLILTWGWRIAFIVTGAMGLLWVLAWLLVEDVSQTSSSRLTGTSVNENGAYNSQAVPRQRCTSILGYREVWALMVSRLIADPAWYFYLFWLPEYLHSARGLELQHIGYFAWVPFVSADLGSVSGGILGTYLMRRGMTLNGARKVGLATCAGLMPLTILAGYSSSIAATIAFISLATFAHQAWTANIIALPADLFPSKTVALVYGISALSSGFGAMIFMLFVGWTVDHFSYRVVFITVGLLHPAATSIIFAMIPRLKPLHIEGLSSELTDEPLLTESPISRR